MISIMQYLECMGITLIGYVVFMLFRLIYLFFIRFIKMKEDQLNDVYDKMFR